MFFESPDLFEDQMLTSEFAMASWINTHHKLCYQQDLILTSVQMSHLLSKVNHSSTWSISTACMADTPFLPLSHKLQITTTNQPVQQQVVLLLATQFYSVPSL